jgi:hypothetical protein
MNCITKKHDFYIDWIQLTQNMIEWHGFVNTEMKLRVSYEVKIS